MVPMSQFGGLPLKVSSGSGIFVDDSGITVNSSISIGKQILNGLTLVAQVKITTSNCSQQQHTMIIRTIAIPQIQVLFFVLDIVWLTYLSFCLQHATPKEFTFADWAAE